jgi:hypothetical protein
MPQATHRLLGSTAPADDTTGITQEVHDLPDLKVISWTFRAFTQADARSSVRNAG